jgi:hypothetical protein
MPASDAGATDEGKRGWGGSPKQRRGLNDWLKLLPPQKRKEPKEKTMRVGIISLKKNYF